MSSSPVRVCSPHPPRAWRFARLLHAPHRLSFAAAVFILLLTSLWWAVVNVAPSEGVPMRWSLPPIAAHSVIMTFGFMPLFFIGFLFTAGPKWLGHPPVDARSLLPAVMAIVSGWSVFALAPHGRDAEFGQSLGAIGLGAVAVGWLTVVRRFVTLVRTSTASDRVHAGLIALGAVYGAGSLCITAAGVATADFLLVRAATVSALWAFIGLVFACVAHRMIPFFSAAAVPALDAWRPLWLLGGFVSLFVFEAVGAVCDTFGWASSAPWLVARAAVELIFAAALLALAVRWGVVQSLRIRLLAMLHLGFTWLGIALFLSGISRLMTAADPTRSLGLAPLHAYTMGFLGSTMVAMVTRVSCGHGGRTLAADDFVWRLFWVLQVAVAARVAAAILPGALAPWSIALVGTAAVGWAGVFVAWGLRYGRWYGMPRPDGKAG